MGLIRECGWSHGAGEQWVLEGGASDNPNLATPTMIIELLDDIEKAASAETETIVFASGLSGHPLIISFKDSKAPRTSSIRTGIRSSEDTGKLGAMLMLNRGYRMAIVEGTPFTVFRKH